MLAAAIGAQTDQTAPSPVREWGSAAYVDLAIGESHRFLDRTIVLRAVQGDRAVVEVDGVRETLVVARQSRPKIVAGVRVFLADNRFVARLTKDGGHPQAHRSTTRDALLCISDPRQPLLDPARFTFPISREEGYKWSMEENSHMFAYLGPLRSHEGVDLDMHNARGFKKHALVAIEDGTVRWVESTLTNANEACVLLDSAAHPGLSYIYMHVNRAMVLVAAGEKVKKGQQLGYIWGDSKWGHLHFSVIVHPAENPPTFSNRYTNLLNAFPQLFELWHGTSEPPRRRFAEGDFEFARQYWLNGNRQRLSAYDDVIGYGWRLGSWCPAAKVETSRNDSGVAPGQSAILRTKMHVDTPYPAENPHDHFVFEIAVENGTYAVQAEVGDRYGATWQRLAFEHIEAGTFALAHGERSWTKQTVVPVADGRLTVRIELQDPAMPAGLSALTFRRVALNTLSRSLGEPSGISQLSDQSSADRAFGGDRDKPGPKPQSWTKLTFKNDSVAEELVDFPVLIKLDETRIKYADARPGGTNLRFMDADGITELPREIETWNPTGISIVWVRVPQIEKAGTRDHIYMFLDAERDSSAGLGSVWNNSYLGVWHFDGLDDSSRHQHKGSNYGSEPVDGYIGRARNFPLNQATYIEVEKSNGANHPLNLHKGKRYTFSCWVWSEEEKAANHYGILLGKGNYMVQYAFFLKPHGFTRVEMALPPRVSFEWHAAGADWKEETIISELRTRYRAWDHIVIDLREDWMPDRFHVNGVKSDLRIRRRKPDGSFKEEREYLLGHKDRPTLEDNFLVDMNIMIGARKCHGRPCVGFDGRIDEMRLMGGVRLSDSWIEADFKSQSDSFVEYPAFVHR